MSFQYEEQIKMKLFWKEIKVKLIFDRIDRIAWIRLNQLLPYLIWDLA
jgi:hypothetical protein